MSLFWIFDKLLGKVTSSSVAAAEPSCTPRITNKPLSAIGPALTVRPSAPLITVSPRRLDNLPADILLVIGNFLPTSSAAALTLCSRRISNQLGGVYLQKINAGKEDILNLYCRDPETPKRLKSDEQRERLKFLLLLERDIYNVIFCYYCRILHTPEKTHARQYNPERPCSRASHSTTALYHREFHISRIQMAMKCYHSGRDPTPHLQQLSKVWEVFGAGCFTYKRSLEACIVSNKILLKSEHRLLLPSPNMPDSRYFITLCDECRTSRKSDTKTQLSRLLRCKLGHYHGNGADAGIRACGFCEGMHRCHFCPTEFQIDVEDVGTKEINGGESSDGVELVITAWLDLGKGITPFDEDWRALFCWNFQERSRRWQKRPLGTIRAAFIGGLLAERTKLDC